MRAGAIPISKGQLELVRWTAGLGAVTAEALAVRDRTPRPASARGRLAFARRAGLMQEWRLLRGRPVLYTVTRGGLRAAEIVGLAPMRVSASSAAHAVECCRAAVALEAAYGEGHTVAGEPAIRSTGIGLALAPGQRTHRPDLLLVPREGRQPPIAVEVELTVKSPRRLETICRCWARERSVCGAIYVVSPEVKAPLRRAIERTGAGDQIAVLELHGRGSIEVVR